MKRTKTTMIVIHRTEVAGDFDEYHFVVHPDGTVDSTRDIDDVGAHALVFNKESVGIAFFGNFAAAEHSYHPTPTEAQITAGRGLIATICERYGATLAVKGHSELGPAGTNYPEKLSFDPDHSCPGTRGDLLGRLRGKEG